MSQHSIKAIERLLARAPHWLRQDLNSADPTVRTRAEETLAAMIAAALAEATGVCDHDDDARLANG